MDDALREAIGVLEDGRHALALERFTDLAEGADEPEVRRAALAFAADVNLTLGRPYETIAWAERLREVAPTPDEANLLEAAACVAVGDAARALELLEHAEVPDSPYKTYPATVRLQLRANALLASDEVAAAADVVAIALREDWCLPEVWRLTMAIAARGEVDLAPLVTSLPEDGLLDVLGWVAESPAAGVGRLLEAMWGRWPGDRRLLALATAVGNRLPLEVALEWSARLRSAGLAEQCAVLGRAARDDLPASERVRAAAVAGRAFGDPRSAPVLELATSCLEDQELADALRDVLELSTDDLVEAFIVAAATTVTRSLLLAGALADRGAMDTAVALARHADGLMTTAPAGQLSPSDRVLPPPVPANVVLELERRGDVGLVRRLTAVGSG